MATTVHRVVRRTDERRLVRRIIATAIAEQGPPDKDQYLAAMDVMRALRRAGYRIISRSSLEDMPR